MSTGHGTDGLGQDRLGKAFPDPDEHIRDEPGDDERTRGFKEAHRIILREPGTKTARSARLKIRKHHDQNAAASNGR